MARSVRCYCGNATLSFASEPLQVVFCHCDDCRRWTGAATPVFAAFADEVVTGLSALGPGRSFNEGVTRWTCRDCGSPLLGRFDYLPDQSWVPLGVLEDAADLAPNFHCFSDRRHAWVAEDGLPGSTGTGRDTLNAVPHG